MHALSERVMTTSPDREAHASIEEWIAAFLWCSPAVSAQSDIAEDHGGDEHHHKADVYVGPARHHEPVNHGERGNEHGQAHSHTDIQLQSTTNRAMKPLKVL